MDSGFCAFVCFISSNSQCLLSVFFLCLTNCLLSLVTFFLTAFSGGAYRSFPNTGQQNTVPPETEFTRAGGSFFHQWIDPKCLGRI